MESTSSPPVVSERHWRTRTEEQPRPGSASDPELVCADPRHGSQLPAPTASGPLDLQLWKHWGHPGLSRPTASKARSAEALLSTPGWAEPAGSMSHCLPPAPVTPVPGTGQELGSLRLNPW